MTDLKDNNQLEEERFVKSLFKESFVRERPSSDFGRHLMDRVMYHWVSNAGSRESLEDKRNRLWLFPVIALVLLMAFLFDMGRLGEQYVNEAIWLNGFYDLGNLLLGWVNYMHWLIPAASAVIIGLLLVDRLLQKLYRQSMNQSQWGRKTN